MPKYPVKTIVSVIALMACLTAPAVMAQQTAEESFTSENAILDTSILFAIGAREARQELRGSFGWPTFQEGLVEGVYFRFDPDGYARFSPSPRLDADVFEVICRPRTYTCMGRKDGLAVTLTSRGAVQIRLENVVESDRFYVADGITELQLPPNVLQPLDTRLELLLSSGGEFVVKRGDAETDRISLVGLSAVTAYLRWLAAKQDYIVLPRGWPVPNSNATEAGVGLTQAASWQSPMPQPLIPQAIEAQVPTATQAQVDQIAETTQDAFELLQGLAAPSVQSAMPQVSQPALAPMPQQENMSLFMAIQALSAELAAFQNCYQPPAYDVAAQIAPPSDEPIPEGMEKAPDAVEGTLAERLHYLIEEIGLPAELALAVARQGDASVEPDANDNSDVVGDILSELRMQLEAENADASQLNEPDNAEYELLSEYFKSKEIE